MHTTKKCPDCHTQLMDDEVCPHCGLEVFQAAHTEPADSLAAMKRPIHTRLLEIPDLEAGGDQDYREDIYESMFNVEASQ